MIASRHSPEERASIVQGLRAIYTELVREFVIDVPDCPPEPDRTPEVSEECGAWLDRVDAEIQVHQLRQFLQTTPLANEAALRSLLAHHMQKPAKSAADRDKLDFLLVQYFSLCAPSGLEESDVDAELVAQVLDPVLGHQKADTPEWLVALDSILETAKHCRRLSELLHSGVLDQGRKLKTQSGERFYDPAALAAFARFNFVIRRIFFRLMHDDLNAIQDGLRELERRSITTIDCRRAQFSAEEPTSRLRMICQSWKVMFHAEYSSGHPLRMLVDLRAAVDDAIKGSIPAKARKNASAAAAGASESDAGATT
jgi:hypothetical protein